MDSSRIKTILQRPPAALSALLLLAIAGFFAVNRLVHKFQHHEQDLGRAMFRAGQQARVSGNPQLAIADFRAALGFDRDNYQYLLNLAKALADAGRTEEAESYLATLWERAPQDGDVNLQLARLNAGQAATEDALRHYHSAIYGIWQNDPDQNRRKSRMELVRYLLQHNDRTQAQSELIAMAAGLPPASDWHPQVADLFMEAGDSQHALGEYRQALKLDARNPRALAGAGRAAYQLGEYSTAERYLRAASEQGSLDSASREILQTSDLILKGDPFRRRLPDSERRNRVQAAFLQAGERLQQCAQSRGVNLTVPTTSPPPLQALYGQWLSWKPRVEPRQFRPGTDTMDTVMDLVAQIEQETEQECGPPTGMDLALLLIARNRDGGDR